MTLHYRPLVKSLAKSIGLFKQRGGGETGGSFMEDLYTFYSTHNKQVLGPLQFVEKFYPVIQNILTLETNGDISDHYCGKRIQNQLIGLTAEKVNMSCYYY